MQIHCRARALRSSECACFVPSQRGGTATDALRGDSPCASAGRYLKANVLCWPTEDCLEDWRADPRSCSTLGKAGGVCAECAVDSGAHCDCRADCRMPQALGQHSRMVQAADACPC